MTGILQYRSGNGVSTIGRSETHYESFYETMKKEICEKAVSKLRNSDIVSFGTYNNSGARQQNYNLNRMSTIESLPGSVYQKARTSAKITADQDRPDAKGGINVSYLMRNSSCFRLQHEAPQKNRAGAVKNWETSTHFYKKSAEVPKFAASPIKPFVRTKPHAKE